MIFSGALRLCRGGSNPAFSALCCSFLSSTCLEQENFQKAVLSKYTETYEPQFLLVSDFPR